MAESTLKKITDQVVADEKVIVEGGGEEGRARQKRLGRMVARDRVAALVDPKTPFVELGIWAAWKMYEKWGSLPAAGVVTGIGMIHGRQCMIVANDATVKAGAMFPQSVKKVLRAQKIAAACRLPVMYLVDSSGVFLPLQEDVFPDEDDFGRIFRNNAVMSAAGIPQFSAIMGNCIAGGGYLPVLSDKLLMTEGSGLYLAGPALVKAAIGQVVDSEELGGARMHASISGTVDFLEPNDAACLQRMRSLCALLPEQQPVKTQPFNKPDKDPKELYKIDDGIHGYDVRDVLACIVDGGSLQEYKAEYGKTIVTGFATIAGIPVGIVANQRIQTQTGRGEVEIGGVLYTDSADKAARFVMDCNQMHIPLIFFQDVMGFMVGKEAEQAGIIRCGAKLVNVVSNSIVPKITVVIGNSFGAGNYALCGKAYDPHFIFAWPNAKYAVMGADQASDTLLSVQKKAAERKGTPLTTDAEKELRNEMLADYERQMDIRYGAARGWVDAIIEPHKTREILSDLLPQVVRSATYNRPFCTGVMQV